MRQYHYLLSAALLSSAWACARDTGPVDTAADEQAIAAVRGREMRAFTAGAIDSALAVFTADAVLMPPNEPTRAGADEIRAWLQGMANQFSVAGRYSDAQLTVSGDVAVERYVADLRLTPKAGGAATEERFKGIHVYRRQSDGSWRITHDVWNADGPPAAATPAN